MARTPELSLRKSPQQERSRQMVERIVDAAARVLAEYGYEGASTHRIAAEAEISSGSLYQYFASKDAVVAAVLDRFADQLGARIDKALASAMGLGWQEAGRLLLTAQFEVFEQNIGSLRTIIERAAQFGSADRLEVMDRRFADLVRLYLLAHRDQFRADLDVEATVWLMVETGSALAIRYVVHPPPIPRERLIDALTQLFVDYLSA